MFFNTVVVPGLAVPAGTNIYKIVTTNLLSVDILLQNFYITKTGDFFVILLIQQISFGYLATITQIGKFFDHYFSPTIIMEIYNQPDEEFVFFKDEGNMFDFGFSYAQFITILSILFIYSFGK